MAAGLESGHPGKCSAEYKHSIALYTNDVMKF